MRKLARILAGLLVPAFLVAGIVATPAIAQDKMAKKMEKAKAGEVVLKEIAQNDKLRVYEATLKPGDTGALCENAKICVSPKIFPTSTKEFLPLTPLRSLPMGGCGGERN